MFLLPNIVVDNHDLLGEMPFERHIDFPSSAHHFPLPILSLQEQAIRHARLVLLEISKVPSWLSSPRYRLGMGTALVHNHLIVLYNGMNGAGPSLYLVVRFL